MLSLFLAVVTLFGYLAASKHKEPSFRTLRVLLALSHSHSITHALSSSAPLQMCLFFTANDKRSQSFFRTRLSSGLRSTNLRLSLSLSLARLHMPVYVCISI